MASLLRSVLSIFSGRVANVLIGLLFTPLLVSIISQDQYGVYASVMAAFSIVTVLSRGGLFDATRKTVAEYADDVNQLSSIISVSLLLSVIYALVALVFVALCIYIVSFPLKYFPYVGPLISVILFGNILNIVTGSFHGLQREWIVELLQVGRRFSYSVLALLLAYLGFDVLGVFVGYAISFLLSSLLGVVMLVEYTSYSISLDVPVERYGRQVASFGGYQLIGGLSATLLYKSDILLVEFFRGTTPTALYQSAIVPAEMIWFVPSAVQLAFLQHTASLWDDRDISEINQLLQTGIKYAVLSLTLFGVGLFALAGPFLTVYYNPEYTSAKTTLQVLIFGTFFLGITRVVTPVLHATGWVRPSELITVVGLVINLALNVVLIPRYGILGAGIGTGLSYVAIFVGNLTLWRYSQFDVVSLRWTGRLAITQVLFAGPYIAIVRLVEFSPLVSLLVFPPLGLILFLGINVPAGYVPTEPAKPYLGPFAKYLP